MLAAVAPDVVIFEEATDPAVIERVAAAVGLQAWGARRGHSLGYASRVCTRACVVALAAVIAARVPASWCPPACDVRVFGVHLSAIHAAWTERRRVREVGALLAAIDEWRGDPHVLVGDFNTPAAGCRARSEATAAAAAAVRLAERGPDPLAGRVARMLEAGYVDVAATCEKEPTPTFPTWGPHLRLDYAFVPRSQAVALRAYRVVTEPPEVPHASDHLPFLIELEVSGSLRSGRDGGQSANGSHARV